MPVIDNEPFCIAASILLTELVNGAAKDNAWILNPEDPGLLKSLDKLSAADASRTGPEGGAPIAAHVDHLRYGLGLLNRWTPGENPFADADYTASWRRVSVSEGEWRTLRDDLREETQKWILAVQQPRTLTQTELTGLLASVAHLAYHVGAIRQINRSIRGPAATD